MSEHQTARLLRAATDDLPVDVARTVAGGLERGLRRQRRRRVRASVAAAAVVGTLGVAVGVGPGLLDQRSGDVGGVASTPTVAVDPTPPPVPPATPDPTPQPTESQPLRAVRAPDIPALVTAVAPGEVVPFEPAGGYIDAGSDQVAHFQLDGFLVTAGITEAKGDPAARCRESYPGASSPCRTRVDGSVLALSSDQGPAVDGGVGLRAVSLYLDGFDIFVLSYNAAEGKDTPVLSPEPPLTYEQLEAVATGDGWLI